VALLDQRQSVRKQTVNRQTVNSKQPAGTLLEVSALNARCFLLFVVYCLLFAVYFLFVAVADFHAANTVAGYDQDQRRNNY
jgi:hypothetical protein